jgi:hypothetical protein
MVLHAIYGRNHVVEQFREHGPIKVLVENGAIHAIARKARELLLEFGQFCPQRCIAAIPDGIPDVLREKAVCFDSATFGYAIHFERSPKGLHGLDESIKIRSRRRSTGDVDEPYPFVIADQHVVRMTWGLLHENC